MVFGHSHALLGGEAGLEELVVGGPPEGVVDDHAPSSTAFFKIGPVVGNFVRDAVNDYGIGHSLVHAQCRPAAKLGPHPCILRVHPVDKSMRESVLPTHQQAHNLLFCH